MKKILLSFLILVSLCTQAQVKHSIRDLQPHDVVGMEITVPVKNAQLNSVWDFEKGYKIGVNLEVLSVKGDSLQIVIKPKRLLVFLDNGTANSFSYFDSNYLIYYDNKPWFYLFEDNSVIASVNLDNWGVNINYKDKTTSINYTEEERLTGRSRKEWFTQCLNIPKGLKGTNYAEPTTELLLDFDKIIKLSLYTFAKGWSVQSKDETKTPWIFDLRANLAKDPNSPAFVQITSASFDLPSNVSIAYRAPKDMPGDRVFMKVGNKTVLPISKENDTYLFKFFLPSPKRTYIGNLIIDLTPNNSLTINYDSTTQGFVFSGKGAANSSFTNQMAQLYDGKLPNIEGDAKDPAFLENIKSNFIKNENFFNSTLDQYLNGMDNYWINSARLSFYYWYVNERIKLYNRASESIDFGRLSEVKQFLKNNPEKLNELKKHFNIDELDKLKEEIDIPWQHVYFSRIFPFGDFLYQPYTYNRFIKDFFSYKAKEANNTIMTGMNPLQEHIPSYYLAKTILWGYPRSYHTSETLKYLMTNFQLEENNREYEDFLKTMHDPEIRESVVNLHEQLMKIEPGHNIKDLKFDIEKHIPLKSKSDKYIILLVGDDKIGFNPNLGDYETNIKEIYESIKKDLQKNNLEGSVELCIITSESVRSNLNDSPEIQSKIVYVPDKEIRDYTDKVVGRKSSFILLKSDGEILSRNHPSEYKSSIYFLMQLIQEDIIKQKHQNSASSGVLAIIISVLFSVLITYFLIRYIVIRREKRKRHIQELELKAIRAQITPISRSMLWGRSKT